MSYPDKPLCHGDMENSPFRIRLIEWEVREADGRSGTDLRHCSYCGSLHPEDLVKVLNTPGVSVTVADWKYGWPHKLYISGIPNPKAGEMIEFVSRIYHDGEKSVEEKKQEPAPKTTWAKFYNEHMLDLVGTPKFELVADEIFKRTRIHFKMQEGKLFYNVSQ